ncbi:putative pentatricopeptide repeat-containing protein At1g03510 [Wolffia australiana]
MAALVRAGRHEAALAALGRMRAAGILPPADAFAVTLAVTSCAALRGGAAAAAFHGHAAKSGLLPGSHFVASALIAAYAKCFSAAAAARRLFDELPHRNAVVWAAAVAAHARAGETGAAAELLASMPDPPPASAFNAVIAAAGGATAPLAATTLCRMHALGVAPTLATALTLLRSAAAIHVRQIHALSLRRRLLADRRLCSAVVEAYGRCGCPASAARIVDSAVDRDVVTWSALMSAYAVNGCAGAADAAFRRMVAAGVRPDGLTFLALIKACSHAGRPDEAQIYMAVMVSHYGIQPQPAHTACLVDALARAGRLEEARRAASRMPWEGSAAAWGALLNAARVHGDVKAAEAAARALAQKEPHNAANLVLLSGAYAAAGMAREAEDARGEIQTRRLARAPGTSWVLLKSQEQENRKS